MADRSPEAKSGALRVVGIDENDSAMLEKVAVHGDIASLTPSERLRYYQIQCEGADLNPYNRPFEYLELDKKLTLYATKRATDEIRLKRGISIEIVDRRTEGDVYIVTARATLPDGRAEESEGAVPLLKEEQGEWKTNPSTGKNFRDKTGKWIPLNPVEHANALMRCESKAKRRVTLSIAGLGMIDESELDTVPNARRVTVDIETGEIQTEGQRALNSGETWDAVHREAHAWIEGIGWGHDQLRAAAFALTRGETKSLKDLSVRSYRALLNQLKAARTKDSKKFENWIADLPVERASEPIDHGDQATEATEALEFVDYEPETDPETEGDEAEDVE